MSYNGSAPSGAFFKNQEAKIPEIINDTLTIMYTGIDPLFNVVASSERVTTEGLGRNYVVKKVFQGNLSGSVAMARPTAYNTLFGNPQATLPNQNLSRNIPAAFGADPTRGVGARPVTMTVPLQAMDASLELTKAEMDADAFGPTIGEIIAPKLTGFAELIARTRCNMFYTDDATNYSLCDMTNVEVGVGGDASKLVFTPSNEATARFEVGQAVDIFFQTSGTGNFSEKLNVSVANETATVASWALNATNGTIGSTAGSIDLHVVAVDRIADRVTLQLAAGAWTVGAVANSTARTLPQGTPARTLRVVTANTKFAAANGEAFSGLNSWIKDGTGSASESIYGVDINQRPEFKSYIYTESGALTEQKLQRHLSAWIRARKAYGMSIDTFVTTQGVLDAYRATKIGKEEIIRSGPLSLAGEGTGEGVAFTHNGKKYMIQTSDWVAYGTMYGVNKSGFTRYAPPRTPGSGSMGQMPSFLEAEFWAPLVTGTDSIRLPVTMAGASGSFNPYSDMCYMPCTVRMEIVPDQLSMIKITGLQEDKVVGNYNTNILADS